MTHYKSTICAITCGFAVAVPTPVAAADAFPARPVRVIVPFAAAGTADVVLRIVAQKLSEDWGQQLVVDDRPGGAGVMGTELASKSSPTGYTLLLAAIAHATHPSLYKKLPYDIVNDFIPITLLASTPSVLLLAPSVPASSVKEFIALAKAKPGSLNFGSPGVGTSSHLAGELFASMAQIKLTHVSYRGSPVIMLDLLAGRIEFYINTLPAAMPQVKAQKLKVLAVTSPRRTALLPDMPTVSETGVPGYEVASWYGVLAPTGTPRPIIQKLNSDFVRAIRFPAVTEKLLQAGAEPVANTPKEFAAFLGSELRKWGKVMHDAGIKADWPKQSSIP